MTNQPINAVSGGTRAMINIEIREPIRMNARKRKKSPSVSPTIPDNDNQNQ